jgi:hypothetical protein
MKHLNQERLIEHHYGESSAAVKRHLEACGECARAYMALERDLAEVKVAESPARDGLYGELVWRSLSNSLPTYALRRPRWPVVWLWRGIACAAACVLLLGAFMAGRRWEQGRPAMTSMTLGKHDERTKQKIVLVVLGDHLDRSERLLVELKHADASNTDTVLPMQQEARSLLDANRLCRQSVTQIDDPALANALDHLGRVLSELANEPGELSGSTITRLQNEMNTDGLLFEVRVLRSRVPDPQPSGAIQPNGGAI